MAKEETSFIEVVGEKKATEISFKEGDPILRGSIEGIHAKLESSFREHMAALKCCFHGCCVGFCCIRLVID